MLAWLLVPKALHGLNLGFGLMLVASQDVVPRGGPETPARQRFELLLWSPETVALGLALAKGP